MKYVVVILDGAAGWPLDELGGRTTLAAAATPNLDALARAGRVGMALTVPAGCGAVFLGGVHVDPGLRPGRRLRGPRGDRGRQHGHRAGRR